MNVRDGWLAAIGIVVALATAALMHIAEEAQFYYACRDVGKLMVNGGVVECHVTRPRFGDK